ncbi:hypothetical protein [Streptomyces sp. XD-27]|uniref:hypothetical protein n=1 Tax=Streptomyces sp. XD-27 TaxID=3062779 RepID=UPI0026F443C3|nr:hypothetical protein [Streptomyces sp. XD-27]WKX68641.1 hypothetical protein Q3Y56_00570 [Streptomyces sp. XD-27]
MATASARIGVHQQLVAFLRAVLAEPDVPVGRIGVLTPEQWQSVHHGVNDTAAAGPELTIPCPFARQAARAPDAVAVVCGPESLTYRELDARSTRLAREPVGVHLTTLCHGATLDLAQDSSN